MAEFIDTIDVLGDDAVIDSIIDRSITEFKDNTLTSVGSNAFRNCTALETVVLPNVTAIGGNAFHTCSALKTVELPEWESEIDYGSSMFMYCSSLEKIRLPKLHKMLNSLFVSCSSLRIIDTGATSWGTGVGQFCSALEALILRNSTGVSTMANATNNIIHSKIASGTGYIYVPGNLVNSYKSADNWSTYAEQFRGIIDDEDVLQGVIDETLVNLQSDKITSIPEYAFYKYTPLKTVECPNVVTIERAAFNGCTELESIDCANVTEVKHQGIYGCSKLTSINLPNLTKITGTAFNRCEALRKIQFPALTTMSAFQGVYSYLGNCYNLEIVDFGVLTNFQGNASFTDSRSIKAIILRSPTVASLSSTSVFTYSSFELGNTKYEHYFYVPRALIDGYKVATNWSSYADHFRALEDYTVDGTTTGELDETKI